MRGIESVATAATIPEARLLLDEDPRGIVLVDERLKDEEGGDVSGCGFISAVRSKYAEARFVLLTGAMPDEAALPAARAGADAYLHKLSLEQLAAALEEVSNGYEYYVGEALHHVLDHVQQLGPRGPSAKRRWNPRPAATGASVLVLHGRDAVDEGIAGLLALSDGIGRVTCAATARPGLDLLRSGTFDLVLVDERPGGMAACDFVMEATTSFPNVPIALFIARGQEDSTVAAAKAGAAAVIEKPLKLHTISGSLRAVLEGHAYFTRVPLGELLRFVRAPLQNTKPLSASQLDVLRGVWRGLTNSEIAQERGTAPETIKTLVETALSRLGASDRSKGVHIARRTGQL